MSETKNNRSVIVGIFIFIGLAILAVTIFTLGSQKKAFTRSVCIDAIFDDVGGLQKGGNVWFSGLKVGTVKNIGFEGDSQVKVQMSIELSAVPHIHTDAKAKISSDGLIGNKIIVIFGGTTAAPNIKENDLLATEGVISTDDMMATMQENNKNILAITTDFKSISRKLEEGEGTLGALLNDPSIANKLNASATDLQLTLANLKQVSENSKHVVANFQHFSNELNQSGNSIHDFVNDTVMYSSIIKSLDEVQKATNTLHQFTVNLNQVSSKLNQDNNTLGLLLNDPATAADIKAMMRNLETSSEKLDENMEAIRHNFLFRRYFRKKNKD
ncbi:MAG: MCE family protein [Bacteroidetes bacterium]|nr:MCE family protein [Bacteroidota bacterium]